MNNLNKYDCDAILISSRENKYYFAKYYSGSGYVLWLKDELILFIDGRYYNEMKSKSKNKVYLVDKKNPFKELVNAIILSKGIKKIGLEMSKLSYQEYIDLSHSLDAECVPVNIDRERAIKNLEEITIIKEAGKIATDSFDAILPKIKVGMREKDVENMLVFEMKKRGAQKESFDVIVASGPNGAFPHAKASDKQLEKNEMITIDFGARYKEYCSDITRTIAIGKPNDKLIEIYEVVKNAQEKAIQMIKPGLACKVIDEVARAVITSAGYGDCFTHNLGHSIGIECHENPRFSPTEETILEVGMILTVEPGIYIEGLGGVRIEDDVLVTENGFEVLTDFTKELICLKGE